MLPNLENFVEKALIEIYNPEMTLNQQKSVQKTLVEMYKPGMNQDHQKFIGKALIVMYNPEMILDKQKSMQKTLTEMYKQGMKQNRQKFIEEALEFVGEVSEVSECMGEPPEDMNKLLDLPEMFWINLWCLALNYHDIWKIGNGIGFIQEALLDPDK